MTRGRLTDLFIDRPMWAAVLNLLLALAGLQALTALPIRQYPTQESATITVETAWPGAPQALAQGFITAPLAQAMATAQGIDYLVSETRNGQSRIRARLRLDADSAATLGEIATQVQSVKYRLPADAWDPVIRRLSDAPTAVMYLGFASDTLPLYAITDYVTRIAQPLIVGIPGVAFADILGGQAPAMRIWLDPDLLAAHQLSAPEVASALQAGSALAAPGLLEGRQSQTALFADTDRKTAAAFGEVVLRRAQDGQILTRLKDVARIERGPANRQTSALMNGHPAVYLAVEATPSGNPLDIVREIEARLPLLEATKPPGLVIANGFDVARFIDASLEEIGAALIETVLIVALVVFVFLGAWRSLVIPVLAIPLSLLGVAALMSVAGFSLNILTMLAMVLAIGLVVDDAIVVVENVHRHLEAGRSPVEAAKIGAREIAVPVLSMTGTLLAVYAPIGLMGGLTGALFREFAFTLAGAVAVSGLVALTLSPVLCAKVLRGRFFNAKTQRRKEDTKKSSRLLASLRLCVEIFSAQFFRRLPWRQNLPEILDAFFSRLAQRYRRALTACLDAPGIVLGVGLAACLGMVMMFVAVRRELAPTEDQGSIMAVMKAPQYANLDYLERYAPQLEQVFRRLPEADTSFILNGQGSHHLGFAGVNLVPWAQRQRSAAEALAEVQAGASAIEGEQVFTFLLPSLPSGGGGLPVQMALAAPAPFAGIYAQMEKLKAAARQSGLFAQVDSDLAFDARAARLEVDHDRAAALGVSMQDVADTLAVLTGENYSLRHDCGGRACDVILQASRADRQSPEALLRHSLKTASGAMVPLSAVARVRHGAQENQLTQFDQMNAAIFSAVPAPGITLGEAVAFLEAQPLPAGYLRDWQGQARQYVQEGGKLTRSFGVALIVIFLLLAAQFGNLR
ncbi:MAG: efflux RND transporter permease subunit, partial [Zoogloeaceae bacterium]|nr:efflux RND transporter permease subunit [Zoogloeaceae bacterium]